MTLGDRIYIAVLSICLILTIVGTGERLDALERPQPVEAVAAVEVPPGVLVGTGCEGPSSIAVAWEESELPVCKQIDRHLIR